MSIPKGNGVMVSLSNHPRGVTKKELCIGRIHPLDLSVDNF